MTNQSTVAVVIVAYRSEATIANAVASVIDHPAVAEVVVVDNASPDTSAAVASAAGATVVRRLINDGFGAGCNAGVSMTNSPLILSLNPDAAVMPGTIDGLVHHLLAQPRAAVVGSRLVDGNGDHQPSRRRDPAPWRAPLEPGLAALLDHRHYRRRSSVSVDWVSAACLLVRRVAFEAVGGFDERYFLYSEETDLCRRLRHAGWTIDWIDGFPTVHVGGHSAIGKEAWVDGWMRFVNDHNRRPGSLKLALLAGLFGRSWWWRLFGQPERATMWSKAAARARQWVREAA